MVPSVPILQKYGRNDFVIKKDSRNCSLLHYMKSCDNLLFLEELEILMHILNLRMVTKMAAITRIMSLNHLFLTCQRVHIWMKTYLMRMVVLVKVVFLGLRIPSPKICHSHLVLGKYIKHLI